MVVTASEEATDAANVVQPEEEDAVLYELRTRVPGVEYRPRLDDAIGFALGRAARRDLVLLLGAQGMDGGADIAASWLQRHGEVAGSGRGREH